MNVSFGTTLLTLVIKHIRQVYLHHCCRMCVCMLLCAMFNVHITALTCTFKSMCRRILTISTRSTNKRKCSLYIALLSFVENFHPFIWLFSSLTFFLSRFTRFLIDVLVGAMIRALHPEYSLSWLKEWMFERAACMCKLTKGTSFCWIAVNKQSMFCVQNYCLLLYLLIIFRPMWYITFYQYISFHNFTFQLLYTANDE